MLMNRLLRIAADLSPAEQLALGSLALVAILFVIAMVVDRLVVDPNESSADVTREVEARVWADVTLNSQLPTPNLSSEELRRVAR